MCREISVAETFISYLKFHTKLRLEYLLCLKKIRLCLVNQSFLYLLEIRNRSFATRILSFTTMAGSTTCGPQLVFARLILKNSAEFFKSYVSAHTCAVHEIYPLIISIIIWLQ